jgi:hypothetical protein
MARYIIEDENGNLFKADEVYEDHFDMADIGDIDIIRLKDLKMYVDGKWIDLEEFSC